MNIPAPKYWGPTCPLYSLHSCHLMSNSWWMMQRAHGLARQILLTLCTRGTCVQQSETGLSCSPGRIREFKHLPAFQTPKLIILARCLKPGGWAEIQDPIYFANCDDDTMKDDYAVAKFFKVVREGLLVSGVDLAGAKKNASLLREAGFINVEEKVFKVPIGLWPKNKTMKLIGLYMRSVIYDGLQAISLGPLTRGLGWTPEEVEVFLVSVRKALMNQSTHSYVTFHVIYGQKPEA